MLCYKDMSFCTAQDCTNLDCPRNTKSSNFNPDEFWASRVSYGNYVNTCKEYKKDDKDDNTQK